jgi:hypothetical protein
MYLKPGNFSDPRRIVFVTGHLLLIFQIVNVDFIFLLKVALNTKYQSIYVYYTEQLLLDHTSSL